MGARETKRKLCRLSIGKYKQKRSLGIYSHRWVGNNKIGLNKHVGWNRIVDITLRYVLDDPRIESRWRRLFPHPFRPVL